MTDPFPEHRNEILLVGRITSPPIERELPSGDVVRSWRVTVDRADGSGRFDSVACAAWTARLQRTAAGWQKGDVVEVSGALRQRFWRSGGGLAGVTEIEVRRARRLANAQPVKRPRKRESAVL